jgi:glycosyltransferase involved in cell wall biosynthesis
VRAQSYPHIEWLVLDDSAQPSVTLSRERWDGLKYVHIPERVSVGAKRNRLLSQATGAIIVHFDDDDFYGPDYISNAVNFLEAGKLDVALLSGFFVAHLSSDDFGYYRTHIKQGPAFAFNKTGVRPVELGRINIPFIHLCFGWSYIYRRNVWEHAGFQELNVFEDREFIRTAGQKFKMGAHEVTSLDCLHAIHARSSSQCFPQFLIPGFMIESLSREAYQHVAWLKRIAAA